MTLEQVQLLRELLGNETFAGVLEALAQHNRKDILMMTTGSYNMQNVYGAAVNTGTLLTLETLPDYFARLLDSQTEGNQ